jgi:hypothetical protein
MYSNLLVKREGKCVPVSKHHAMKIHGGVEVKPHTFLILALDACKRSTSCSGHPERAHWIGGCWAPEISK